MTNDVGSQFLRGVALLVAVAALVYVAAASVALLAMVADVRDEQLKTRAVTCLELAANGHPVPQVCNEPAVLAYERR